MPAVGLTFRLVNTLPYDPSRRASDNTVICSGFIKQMRAVISSRNPAMNLGRVMLKLGGGRPPHRIICVGHSLGGAVSFAHDKRQS